MDARNLFSGNALDSVDADGSVALPGFVRRAIGCGCLVLGAHETDPCVTGYDPALRPAVHRDLERRRVDDETSGAPAARHHSRVRRAFGFAEDAALDAAGRVVLPPLVRRRARIAGLALFVGTGARFEIWNPHLARESGDEDLRELAEWRLAEAGATNHDSRESEG